MEFILRKKQSRWVYTVKGEDIYWELEDFDIDDEEYRNTPRPNGFLDDQANVSLKDIFKRKKKNSETNTDTK